MKTCAIIDLFSAHDHIIPSHIDYLQRLGYRVTVFSPTTDFRQVTHLLPALSYDLVQIHHNKYERSGIRSAVERYLGRYRSLEMLREFDLVVINTFRMELPVINAISATCLNVLAVLHMPWHNMKHKRFRFFSSRGHRGLVLSKNLSTMYGLPWLAPLTYAEDLDEHTICNERRTLCVPGTVRFTGRTYLALVRAVKALKTRGRRGFVVKILGRHMGRDGLTLKTAIDEAGVGDYFTFLPDTSHDRFLTEVFSSDCVLPLIDSTEDSMGASHYHDVITSSIPLAVGLGCPILTEQRLADAYEIGSASFTHVSRGLESGIVRALDVSPADLLAKRRASLHIRSRFFEASLNNLREIV